MNILSAMLLGNPIPLPKGKPQKPHYMECREFVRTTVFIEAGAKSNAQKRKHSETVVIEAIRKGINTVPDLHAELKMSRSSIVKALERMMNKGTIIREKHVPAHGGQLFLWKEVK